MYERLKQFIDDLDSMDIQPFIGYGNPDAKILIIGKECAFTEGSEDWIKFYQPNFKQWKDSFNGHGFGYKHGKLPYDFDNSNFHPIYPFYQQENTTSKYRNGTSRTYYYYQRLIDKIRGDEAHKYIDFFQDCFITELNDKCRPNNNNLEGWQHRETENNIRERFDWMSKTKFFNQFRIVILACGPYARKIEENGELENALFGNGRVYRCHQLSFWDKSLDGKIAEMRSYLK